MILLMIHLIISLGALSAHEEIEGIVGIFFFKFGTQVYSDGLMINSYFIWSSLIRYVHNDCINEFSSILEYHFFQI